MSRRSACVLVVAYVLVFGCSARVDADEGAETEASAVAAFEFWSARSPGGHGWVIAHSQWRLPNALVALHYNTETLRLMVDDVPLVGRHTWGAQAAGEYGFAGLLPDYYQDGQLIESRGFGASWLMAQLHARFFAGNHHTIQPLVAFRQWFFDVNRADLAPPPDTFVVESTLRYTYWNMEDLDPGIDIHRPYPRRTGIMLMLEGGVHTRSETEPWGALDPARGEPDPRNDPSPTIVRLRASVEAGSMVGDVLRFRWSVRGAYGVGEDDLTRDRLGGMNPFVTPIAGAPWAGWLSETYGGAEWGALFSLGEHEFGPFATAVILQDRSRRGTDEWGGLFGAGLHADLRLNAWQIDARTALSPTIGGGVVGVSGLVSVGRRFGS